MKPRSRHRQGFCRAHQRSACDRRRRRRHGFGEHGVEPVLAETAREEARRAHAADGQRAARRERLQAGSEARAPAGSRPRPARSPGGGRRRAWAASSRRRRCRNRPSRVPRRASARPSRSRSRRGLARLRRSVPCLLRPVHRYIRLNAVEGSCSYRSEARIYGELTGTARVRGREDAERRERLRPDQRAPTRRAAPAPRRRSRGRAGRGSRARAGARAAPAR